MNSDKSRVVIGNLRENLLGIKKSLVKYFKLVFRDFQRRPLICFSLICNLTECVLFKKHQNKEKPSEGNDKVDSPEGEIDLSYIVKIFGKLFFMHLNLFRFVENIS